MSNQLKTKIIRNIEEKQLSIGELEKQAGLKKNAIRNIIEGRSKNPTMETLISLAAVLGCSIDQLVTANDELHNHELAHNRKNAVHEWDEVLFTQAASVTQEMLSERKIMPSFEQVVDIIKEIYLFSLGRNDSVKSIDTRFAKWFIEKTFNG